MKFKKETKIDTYNNNVYYKKTVYTSKKYADESIVTNADIADEHMTEEEVQSFIELKTRKAVEGELERTKDNDIASRGFLIGYISIVMFYKHRSEGEYQLIKSVHRSSVYFVRPLERSSKLEEMIQSNVNGARHTSHLESGYVLLNLSQFEIQIIGGVSVNKFVLLRDSIIGASSKIAKYIKLHNMLCARPLSKRALKYVKRYLQIQDEYDMDDSAKAKKYIRKKIYKERYQFQTHDMSKLLFVFVTYFFYNKLFLKKCFFL